MWRDNFEVTELPRYREMRLGTGSAGYLRRLMHLNETAEIWLNPLFFLRAPTEIVPRCNNFARLLAYISSLGD